MPLMGRWLQIMVTMDANKMHQNVAFPGMKFQNFLERGTAPSPHYTATFLMSFRSLIVVFRLCRGPILIKTLIITVLLVFLCYNCY